MEWVRGECLGFGSSSTVHLATSRIPSSTCPSLIALKSCDRNAATLLENERNVMEEIGFCPQIIQFFGASHTTEDSREGLYNLVLEYAKGGSLSHKLKKAGGCLRESEVRDYTRSILKGLRHIHAKGFVHCDLKLENLLLIEDGVVKIADFGLAKKAGQKQGRVEIRGTPLYMAPESVNDNEYESGCDIWALGCAVVEMLTGKPAWDCKPGTNSYALLMRIGVGDELPIVPENLSQEGKDFLSKCFVKDATQRWSADMLLEHPFVADDQEIDTVPLKGESDELSTSPKCHFEFSEWASVQSMSPRSEFWSDEKVESIFPSLNSSSWASPADRIRQLACDQSFNWSDSECWVTVR